jgi:hypothetical protein
MKCSFYYSACLKWHLTILVFGCCPYLFGALSSPLSSHVTVPVEQVSREMYENKSSGDLIIDSTSEKKTLDEEKFRKINTTAPNDLLKQYSGDFTDTDGNGMTDAAELFRHG